MMTIDEAIALIRNEKACVVKAEGGCSRECSTCELLRKSEDIIRAYDMAIKALENLNFKEVMKC